MVDSAELKKKFDHAEIYYIEPDVLLIRATSEYIPINQFKEIFKSAGELVQNLGVTKMIFDKQNLRVFHQPSMEWYFVDWKGEMADLGLKTHRKILPDDMVFRESVKVGRKKISRQYPEGTFNQLDIQYAENLDEALKQ